MDAMKRTDGHIVIDLSPEEALVLADCLHRWEDEGIDETGLPFVDQGEQRVFWNLSAVFEPVLGEIFRPDYDDLVERARAALRDPVACATEHQRDGVRCRPAREDGM